MDDEDACYMLASWAKQFCGLAQEVKSESHPSLTEDLVLLLQEITGSLKTLCQYIDPLPLYWIDPEVQRRSKHLFEKLAQICLWPQKLQISRGLLVRGYTSALAAHWANSRKDTLKWAIVSYLSDPGNKRVLEDFRQDCLALLDALKSTEGNPNGDFTPNLERLSHPVSVEHCQALFKFLQQHCRCISHLHSIPEHGVSEWHSTRLCLELDRSCTEFGILVSSKDMSSWQEFRLTISTTTESKKISEATTLRQGLFCPFLDQETFSRISFSFELDGGLVQIPHSSLQRLAPPPGGGESLASVLRDFQLTPRDRIRLAYAIAKGYWQFYDSDLMRTKWSSESIWFMPSANSDQQHELPLRVFLTLPFGTGAEPSENAAHDADIPVTHRFPRILALGIILLEVGLASPFPTKHIKDPNTQANYNHSSAVNLLEALRSSRWASVPHQDYFTSAVEFCLTNENFNSFTIQPHEPANLDGLKQLQESVAIKKTIHDKVVLPLAYLAGKCSKGGLAEMTYITRKAELNVVSQVQSPTVPPGLGYESDGSSLKDGVSESLKDWIRSLKLISDFVYEAKKNAENTTPIRVAILDTGVRTSMDFYQKQHERLDRIVGWKDYVNPENESSYVDEFGHGSLMARLVAEVCFFADILVVRVVETPDELSTSSKNIAEGIRWAGAEGAHIISMSIGLSVADSEISQAIHDVSSKNEGVIFLASAGNSSDEPECFPACHPAVISIYATNPYGTFAESNAQRPTNGSAILGSFGDQVHPKIQKAFDKEFPGICSPGSSIATAVVAGIGATMLAYVALLPRLVKVPPSNETKRVLGRIYSSQGMEAIFRAMAQDKYHGRFFINPAQFWMARNSPEARYHEIFARLWEVDRRLFQGPPPP